MAPANLVLLTQSKIIISLALHKIFVWLPVQDILIYEKIVLKIIKVGYKLECTFLKFKNVPTFLGVWDQKKIFCINLKTV